MENPKIKPESEIKSVENELDKISTKISSDLLKFQKILEKYDFLEEKDLKIDNFWKDGLIQGFYDELISFYKDVEHGKINPGDKKDLNSICAGIIQQLEVSTSYIELKEEYTKLSQEADPIVRNTILDNIRLLKSEKDSRKNIDHKNTIISNLEKSMATGKGPGNNNFGNRGSRGFQPETIEEWKEMEEKKAEIEKSKKEHEAKIKKDSLDHEYSLKSKEDPTKSEKGRIAEIAEKEANGILLDTEEEDLKIKYPLLFKKELAKHLDTTKDDEDMIAEIAAALIDGKKLNGEQKLFLKDSANKAKVDVKKTELEAESVKLEADIDAIAKKLASGIKPAKLTTAEKKIYKEHKEKIEDKIPEHESDLSETKDQRIDAIAEMIANGTVIAIGSPEEADFKKYETEILTAAKTKLEKSKTNEKTVKEIALLEVDGKPLTTEQELYTRIPGERRKIDDAKDLINIERMEQDRIANILATGAVLTDPVDLNFYNEHKDAIDAKVVIAKAERIENLKKNIINKAIYNGTLTKEEEDIYNANKAELDPKILDALKLDLRAAIAAGDTARAERTKAIIESRLRLSLKSKEEYEPLILRFKDVNERIIALESKEKLITGEEELLTALKTEKDEIYASLDKLGPSGRGFADLEVARNNLAKSSQQFQKSFVNKFPGSKILGVMAGMFGSKWSAVKEGENTPAMQEKMRNSQLAYEKVRKELMNVFIGEEYTVREAFGQDLKNLSAHDKSTMETFLNNVNKEFISEEYKKLDQAKNVLESTVRGSAMNRFGQWYSKGGPYKNVKNPLARKILNRVTSGAILGAGMFLVPGIGAGAAFGTYMGYRAARAVASATVGESLAMAVAYGYGGKLNDRGEFEKFANTRDKAISQMEEDATDLMMKRLEKEEKPLMTPAMMQKLTEDHNGAVNNYMNSSGNARRAEMWTRLIVGGLAASSVHYLLPNPTPPIGFKAGEGVGKAPIIDPIEPPTTIEPEPLVLEGVSTEASAKGSISTFMKLKEMMIDKYANDSRFAGLSREEIAQKMIDDGNLDPFAEEIMGSKSLQDFIDLATRRGFWDPSGAGNSGVDSASVPKGSIIGLETGADGDLHYFIDTPNGERVSLSNFGEISGTQKGVGMIDTDGSSRSGLGRGNNPGPATGLNTAPPDTSLDESDYNYGQNVNNAPGPNPDNTNIYNPGPSINEVANSGSSIDDQIAKYRQFKNPGDEHSYYLSKGFSEKGLQGTMRGTNPDVTTEYYDDAGNFYYTEKAALYEKFRGTEHDIKNSPMYREYHSMADRYNAAQAEIAKLEDAKFRSLRAETESMMTPDGSTKEPLKVLSEEEMAIENQIKNNAKIESNKWVDDSFSKKPLFGKRVEGIKTNEWDEFKDDRIFDHIAKSKKSVDDVYGPSGKSVEFTGTRKEVKFLDKLYERSNRLKMPPASDETVEQFMLRLAEAEQKQRMSSSR